MEVALVLLAITMRFICVENRMLPRPHKTKLVSDPDRQSTQGHPTLRISVATQPTSTENEEYNHAKVLGLKNTDSDAVSDYTYEYDKKLLLEKLHEPCAIVVFSNIQSPTMQSLLRKYKYDSNGSLIPSSVKYFMKVPQGIGAPMLVPLNDKSFTHLGGFVRYYKEVPPIPQAW